MEAKELMIGDWYYDQELQQARRWHQLQYYEEYGNSTYMEFCQPISLTESILVKNGIDYEYDNIVVKFHIIISQGQRIGVNGNFIYVHELQHALRLCGLEELADNFKLKAMEE